jgi:hypothetical protein
MLMHLHSSEQYDSIDVLNVLDHGILAFCLPHIVQQLFRNPCHKWAGNIVQPSEIIFEGDKVF